MKPAYTNKASELQKASIVETQKNYNAHVCVTALLSVMILVNQIQKMLSKRCVSVVAICLLHSDLVILGMICEAETLTAPDLWPPII